MTKGKYHISEGKSGVAGIPPSPQDASFKSCVCTMLILIALLLLVILWLYPLKQHDSPGTDKMSYTSRNRGEKEERTEEKYFTSSTSKQFEKMIEYPTTQPSKTTIEIEPTQESTTLISILTTWLQTTAMTKAIENVTKTVNITTPFAEDSTESLTSLKHSTTPSSEVFIDLKTTKDVTSDTTTVSYMSEHVEKITEASSGKLEMSKEIESTNDLLYPTSVITHNDDTVTSTTADIISAVMSSQDYTTTEIVEASEIYTVTTMNIKEDKSTMSNKITTNFDETTTVLSDDITTYYYENTTVLSDDITTDFDETTTVLSDDITTYFDETTTVLSDDITTYYYENTTVLSDDITTDFDETTTVLSDDITTDFDETTTVLSDDITTDFDETTTVLSDDITTDFDETTTVLSDDITTDFDETTTVMSDDITTDFDETATVLSDDITTAIEPLPLQTSTTTVTTTTFVPTILPPTATVPAPTVCGSESCKVLASRMLSLINHMQDPCEDFYQFACGGLRRSSTLLEENIADDVSKRVFKMLKSVNGDSPIIYQKLKTYYKSCVDYDKTVPLDVRKKQGRDIFNSVGSMVMSGTPTTSLTELLIQLFHYDSAPLFDINLDVDDGNTSKFTIVITQPKWMSSMFQTEKDKTSRCRYKPDENINTDLNSAYKIYLNCLKNHTKFFDVAQEAMEAFNVFNGHNATILIQETRMGIEWDVLELIEALPLTSDINLDLQTKAFEKRFVGSLQNNSLIEWGLLFEALFGFPVSSDTIVQVYFPKYFDKISYELKNKDPRKLHNALLGIFAHNLYTDLVQTNHPCDREQYCLKVAAGLMPQVVSNMYLQSFHSADLEDIVNKTSIIYSSLISTMKEQVTNSTWMNPEAHQSVIKKLEFMTLRLPFHFNDSELQETYSELDLESQNYLNDSVLLTRIYRKDLYSHYRLNPRSEKAVWSHFLNSFNTKTLYIYGTNTLVVPLSILLPLLDTSIPSYITMAKVGYHLAQGIAHGFERTGALYDWYGGNNISVSSFFSYDNNVEISKTLFSYSRTQKEDKVYSFVMNTYQTLNFRLSDVTAAKLALETARKLGGMEEQLPYADFTPHQTFHIILLQGFCTTKMIPESLPELFENDELLEFIRVNYIAANIEDFGTAFKCINGSTMNPNFRSEPFPVFEDDYVSYDTAST